MTRTTMWENIGVKASKNDFDTLIKEADLDYTAVAKDMYIEHEGSQLLIPGKKQIIREDTGDFFGIVSDRYQICQNRDAFEFVKYIDDLELLKAGSTRNGGVYMIAQLPEITVLNDSIRPHLIFQNSHDGSSSIRATICMLRLVCQNQFITSFKESPATIKVHHSGDLSEKLLVARDTLAQVNQYVKTFDAEANDMAIQKVTPAVFNKIIGTFFEQKAEYSDRQNQRIEENRETFLQAYNSYDNQNFKGTKWGIVNAFADYNTHQEPSRKTANWEENTFVWGISPAVMDAFIRVVKAA